jgi:hypothetical protein
MPLASDDRLAQPIWLLIVSNTSFTHPRDSSHCHPTLLSCLACTDRTQSLVWVPLQAIVHLENRPDYIVCIAFNLFPVLFCLTTLAPTIRSLCGTVVLRSHCNNNHHLVAQVICGIYMILDLASFSFDLIYEPIPQKCKSPPATTITGPILAQSLPKDVTHIDTVGLWRERSNSASYHNPNLPLPVPPSVTRIWRSRIKRRIKGMKRYWKEVGQQLRLSKGQKQYDGQVSGVNQIGATPPLAAFNEQPRRRSILDAPVLPAVAIFDSPVPFNLPDEESVTRSDTDSHSPPRTPSPGITFAPLPPVPSLPALPTPAKKAIKMVRLKNAFRRLRGSSTSSTVSHSESSASSWSKRSR